MKDTDQPKAGAHRRDANIVGNKTFSGAITTCYGGFGVVKATNTTNKAAYLALKPNNGIISYLNKGI
jgi:hypothetical protein